MTLIYRSIAPITISEYYQGELLKKYKYDPDYQREEDVWSEEQKSFLVDSILKNLPIQQIVLHQKISKKGELTYEVIDGKQRLLAIKDFIENKTCIPKFFGEDLLGDKRLNGLKFKELQNKDELSEYLNIFWSYFLCIEYVKTESEDFVNTIFDRLNRNGVRLKHQELRKAKYSNTELYHLIEDLSKDNFWGKRLSSLKVNRMDDKEFLSEILFTILEDSILSSEPGMLDSLYEKWKDISFDNVAMVKTNFNKVTDFIKELDLNFEELKINGVTHLYGLWCFANYCLKNEIEYNDVSEKIKTMFINIRAKKYDDASIKKYKESMESNTKSKKQREKRVAAVVEYCITQQKELYNYYKNEIFNDFDSGEFYRQNYAVSSLKLVLPEVLMHIPQSTAVELGKKIVEIAPSNNNPGSYEAASFISNLENEKIDLNFLKGIFTSIIIKQYSKKKGSSKYYLWIRNEYLKTVLHVLLKNSTEQVCEVIGEVLKLLSDSDIDYYTGKNECEKAISIINIELMDNVIDISVRECLTKLVEGIERLKEKCLI